MEKKGLNIINCPGGILMTNCYIIYKKDGKEAIVIDPGGGGKNILEIIKKADLELAGIFLTHGHFDHIAADNDIKKECKVKTYIGMDEKDIVSDMSMNCSDKFGRWGATIEGDEFLQDNELVNIADLEFKVIKTPGHTKGSVCFYFEKEKVLFSGDTLFRESVGRTDFPTGDIKELTNSIRDRLKILEDDVVVYPGHGDSTTIGYERKNNIYFSEN